MTGAAVVAIGGLGSGDTGIPLWCVCALAFAGVLAVALVVLLGPGLRAERAGRRLRVEELQRYRLLGAVSDRPPDDAAAAPGEGALTTRALSALDRLLRAHHRRAGVVDELERAGLRLRPEEWAAMQIAAVVVPAALLAFVTGSLVAVPLGGALGWFGVRGVVRVRTGRRTAAFEAALPDALQLLAGALRSGFALNQAIGVVVREGVEPVAAEFGRALQEVRLGAELVDALDATSRRMRSYDMELVVMAIRTTREVGGNLAEVLGTTVATMRERVELRGQVRVLSAEGRLSAKLLTGLPVLMVLYLYLFRRDYLRPLYTTGVGYVLDAAGVVLLVLGSLWLNRLTKIEV